MSFLRLPAILILYIITNLEHIVLAYRLVLVQSIHYYCCSLNKMFLETVKVFFFTIFICICKCNEQGIIALVSLILKGPSKKNGKFAQSPLKQILLTERKRKFLFSPYLGSICVRTLPLSLPHFLLQKPWETNQRQGKTSSESKDRRKTQKDKVMADQATFTAPSC